MKRQLNTVDLFCGAGGASTGMEEALARLQLTHRGLAINHWSVAVDTMRANHPCIDTKQMSIEEAVPADLVPGGEVDLLWASPSCTHHSRAKGGKPRSNQLRAQPELVLTWLDQLFVRRMIIENVPEFVDWGPLTKDGRPIERLKGSCFQKWVEAIEARCYKVEWRILNCADYGDATTRRRFFLQAVRKGCGRIRWPEPTHAENPETDLWGHTPEKWRGVRECLDLTDLGTSIFNRKHPLSKNTLRRVAVGMKKYNGMGFLMDMLGIDGPDESRLRSLDEPMPTQHSGGNRCAVVKPFVVRMNRHCDAESIDDPLSTATTKEHHALCQPLIVDHLKSDEAKPADLPLGSQPTHDRFSVVQPFIIDYFGLKHDHEHHVKGVDKPLPTLTTETHHYLCTPFIITEQTGNAPRCIDEPLRAQTTVRKDFLCQPLVLGQQGGAECRPVDKPCPTIATAGAIRVATPVILDMSRPAGNDSGHIGSADKPVRTITTYDNMQVALPMLEDGRVIDIRLRMLKPSELAAAHSFPADYKLTGNRGDQVKQIGNSVPCRTAAAICEAALSA